ncbi:MAG: NfeD family protein [Planctomycetota bacterium]|nr:NfeD family protein [Planctomycetota bacterium]
MSAPSGQVDMMTGARRGVRTVARLVMLLCSLAALWTSATAQAPAVGGGVPKDRQATNIAIITIRGEIDAQGVMAESVERRIRLAERAGADALVFEIDTPGGAVDSVLRICTAIKGSTVQNTAAWINRDAYSGGAIIALACRRILVNDPVNFGDAMPVSGGPLGIVPQEIPTELLKKVLTPLLSDVRDSARRHNEHFGAYLRDEYLVQSIVANDVELWYVRNRETGVRVAIDRAEFERLFPGADAGGPTRLAGLPQSGGGGGSGAAESAPDTGVPAGSRKMALVAGEVEGRQTISSRRPVINGADAGKWELLEKATDGTAPAMLKASDMMFFGLANNDVLPTGEVVHIRSDADVMAYFQGSNLLRLDRTWSEGLTLFLTNIVVRAVLVMIFLVALFVEMTHPGTFVPGLIALAALVALVAPPMLIGMSGWWAIAAIGIGIGLLLVEAFVLPGFGVAGVVGLVLLFAGLIGTFLPRGEGGFPGIGEGGRPAIYGSTAVLLATFTAGVVMYFIAKNFGSLPILGRLVLKDPGTTEESEGFLADAFPPSPAEGVKVGDEGVALTPLRPAGRVEVGERVIDAVAEFGFIDAGSRVRIVTMDGFRTGVERV